MQNKARGAEWYAATSIKMICEDCKAEITRTGRCQKVCPPCKKIRQRKASYKIAVAKGIKNPGVGTGNGQGSGPSHHSWVVGSAGYRKYRKESCERCSSVKFLCVHHKDHDRTHNDPDNLGLFVKLG